MGAPGSGRVDRYSSVCGLMPLPGSTQRINQPSCQKLTYGDRGGQQEAEGAVPTGSPTLRANSMHYQVRPLSLSQSTLLSTSACLFIFVRHLSYTHSISLMVTVHLMLLSVHNIWSLGCPFFMYADHNNCNSMAIEIYDLSCSSCRYTYMHTDSSCLTVSCITSGNLWLFFWQGLGERECKWVQTAGAFLVARSDGGPGGLTHQPLVLPPPFRQKPTREKVGKLLQQRDQMVQKVKSTAHSVSMTLLVTWAMLLMPSWPTGFWRVWTAPPSNWHHVWVREEVLPVNLTHAWVFWPLMHNGCCHLLYIAYCITLLHMLTNQYTK